MTQLLNLFGFLSVILRAATLACQSLAGGGLLFALICLGEADERTSRSIRRLIAWAATALAVAQLAFILTDSLILRSTTGLPWGDVVTAGFFVSGVICVMAALLSVRAARGLKPGNWWTLIPVAGMLGASLMTSHAAARVERQVPALILTGLHQAATMAWVGGLPFFLLVLSRAPGTGSAEQTGRRFSLLAQWSVAGILLSGGGLGLLYVGSGTGLYGTSYGLMVLGKVALFAVVVGLGALNYFLVRELKREPLPLLRRLRRLSEAEIGIGFTVILAAASLTSQPPAVDLPNGRVTVPEIVQRFTPRTPRFQSPPHEELSPATLNADLTVPGSYVPGAVSRPSTPGDIAWSEYNHNWSGLVVLSMGILAVASRIFRARWARHWPLAFFGLAFFLLLRADPEAWPLGPKGFWVSMVDPEVLQHRLFALMIVAFAIFEWGIQVERIRSKAAALVFPSVCALGGALLLTHSHALGNVKEEYLAELSHLPIAVFAVTAGWARWLEQRMEPGLEGAQNPLWRRVPSAIWPVCFVLIGLMLLFYRES